MKQYLVTIIMLVLAFSTSAQTNFIRDTGNIGIGTLTPSQKLEIAANGPAYMQLTNNWDVMGGVGAMKFNLAGWQTVSLEILCPGK